MIITVKSCLNCNVDHEWIFDSPTLKELRTIKKLTGMGQTAFAEAGDEGDPEALAALLYILHMRTKITVPFEDIDLDFRNFDMRLTEEEQRQMEEAEKQAAALGDSESPKAA